MAGLTSQQQQVYDAQITSLYEQVVQCDDPKYADNAKYMLASRLIIAEKYDGAQEILDTLPEHNALDKRSLQAQLWLKEGKNEEAAALLERKLLTNLQETQVVLASLAKIAVQEGDTDNAVRLAQCGQKEAELFGLWEYSAFVVPLETAVLRKDVADSLSVLQSMLAAILIPWDMKQSPVCKHIQQKTAEGNLGMQFLQPVLSELEHSPEYDFLRTEPAFQELLNQYRAKYCPQNPDIEE